jgi:hypothetical protein
MQLKEMSVGSVIKHGIKKVILETSSVKFWAACFMAYLNYDLVMKKQAFDTFGIFAFLALLGIREAADYLGKKTP